MRLVFHGGFGEKGRTALGVETDTYRLLLDVGVNTSAEGAKYYPAIDEQALRATDAIVLTRAHEDHVAALGWCIAHGFQGRILVTRESEPQIVPCIAAYGEREHVELVRNAIFETLPLGDSGVQLGPLRLTTGRSGHAVGGVWCLIESGSLRFCYCGDVVPASPVFVMDPVPKCDVIAIDASYADDEMAAADRARQIAHWMSAHWREGEMLPRAALLCHDGMGLSGPSRRVLGLAREMRHPTLFTGHLPVGTPGERMVAEGYADWIRLPTHPTLTENIAMVLQSEAKLVLCHSCEQPALARLGRYLPSLRSDVATGDSLQL